MTLNTDTFLEIKRQFNKEINDDIEFEGNIVYGQLIGKITSRKYKWCLCPDCRKGRWVALRKNNPEAVRCKMCHLRSHFKGSNNPRWKGGLRPDGYGYLIRKITPDNPFYCMCRKGQNDYISEHRLVMAVYLGRALEPWEIVHHKNHRRTDNRIENLELLPSHAAHLSDSVQIILIQKLRKRVESLEERVLILEAENILLHNQGAQNGNKHRNLFRD